MTFENALREVKEDQKAGMRLPTWSPDTCVKVCFPENNDCRYLYIENRFGKVPWIPAYPEIFSNNWEVIGI